MLLRLLRSRFKSASLDSGKDCVINYVWLNKYPDTDGRAHRCSVSFKHLDCAYENARKYPDARVKIWVDYNLLDARSRDCLQEHFDRFAPKNAELVDINDILEFRNSKVFQPETLGSLWARVDLARLIVLDHVLKNEPERHAIYADFDVPDVKVRKAKIKMGQYGLALGTTGAGMLSRIWDKMMAGELENGYFAFRRDSRGLEFLTKLINKTFESANSGNNGYAAFSAAAGEWARTRDDVKHKRSMAVPAVLYSMGYKIPEKPRYQEWKWN